MIDANYYRNNLRCQLRIGLQLIFGASVSLILSLTYLVWHPKSTWALIAAILAVFSGVCILLMMHDRRANTQKLRELGGE